MQQHKQVFIINFFEKAEIALKDSRKAIDNDSLLTAQNRIYYAIFYAVMSLGYFEGFITSKHGQLMGWFNKKFIHEDKIFDKNLFIIYDKAFKNRMDSDYSFSIDLDKNKVESNYTSAKYFVETIKTYLKNKGVLNSK